MKVSRLSSQQLFSIFKLSTFLTLHGITIWRHSIHGQQELFDLYILTLLVSILDMDSCFILLCLHLYILIALLDVLPVLVACHHKNYLCYHLPTRGRAGLSLGMLIRLKRIYNFCLFHAYLCDFAICFDAL